MSDVTITYSHTTDFKQTISKDALDSLVKQINDPERKKIPVFLDLLESNRAKGSTNPYELDLERLVGEVEIGSGQLAEGQISFKIKALDVPLGNILKTLIENSIKISCNTALHAEYDTGNAVSGAEFKFVDITNGKD